MKNVVVYNRPSLGTDFDRLFDSVFGLGYTAKTRSVAVDVHEGKDKYTLEAELPGYSEQDVQIRVEDNLLYIESSDSAAAKPADGTADQDDWVIRERPARAFRRSFALPKEADTEAISAAFKNGLLTIEIPKTEKAKPRTIAIQKV